MGRPVAWQADREVRQAYFSWADNMAISLDNFLKMDLRVCPVIRAEPYPEARKSAIKVWVDFAPKQIVKFMSECLVLGFPDKNGGIVLVRPDDCVADGIRLI